MRVAPITFLYLLIICLFFLSCTKDKKKTAVTKQAVASQELLDLIAKGDSLYDLQEFDSSYYHFTKAKSIAFHQKNTKKIVYCIFSLADIHQKKGDYIGSEATAIEALSYLDKIKNPNYAWNIYIILGVNDLHQFNYSTALHHFNKAYKLNTDKLRKLNTQNNIALVYLEQGKYKEAIKIFNYLIEQTEIKNDSTSYARIIDNLGTSYESFDPEKSLNYYNQCHAIQIKIKNEWGLIVNHINLAKHYRKIDSKIAQKHAIKSYLLATKWKSTNDQLIALNEIIHNSEGIDLKKYALLYIKLNDSLTKEKQISKNQFAKIKYDSSITNKENETLKRQKILAELELEREKYKKLLSYVLIGLMLLVSITIYYSLLYKNKIEKSKAIYESETRISKKLHDELANDIYQTITLIESSNLSLKENKEQLLINLDVIYSQTRNISHQNRVVTTDESYSTFLKQMIATYNSPDTQIILTDINLINWEGISSKQKIAVYRVIQELLVNMKKHSKSSFVHFSFKNLLKEIQIDYTDNGIGINPQKISEKNGLKNAENRLKAINGILTYNSVLDKGFKATIKFPIKYV